MRLKSNLSLEELLVLINDVMTGPSATYNYSFIDMPEVAYVSTHEAISESEQDSLLFTDKITAFLKKVFNKNINAFSYDKTAEYSVFNNLLTTQSGLVRILWLNNKILSVLVGSKPTIILPEEEFLDKRKLKTKNNGYSYSPYFFGFSEASSVNNSLSEEDKEKLMALPKASWFVSEKSTFSQANVDSNKSMSISENYIRHGSIERNLSSDTLDFLIYPRKDTSFLNKGGSYGSCLPSLVKELSDFSYSALLNLKHLDGESDRYRNDYANSIFINSPDIEQLIKNKSYLRISINSASDFYKLRMKERGRDIITRKHSILTDEDSQKYTDNPRYDLISSQDNLLYYVRKSDKLKATALQTRITKSLREDFISFINWLGYYQFAADLDKANLDTHFMPTNLYFMKLATWIEPAFNTFINMRNTVISVATTKYKELYLEADYGGSVNVYRDMEIFNSVFSQYSSSNRYNIVEHDPINLLKEARTIRDPLFSFNKKFSLEINIGSVLTLFSRGINESHYKETNRIFYNSPSGIISFLATNFLLSDAVEQDIEKAVSNKQRTLTHDNGTFGCSQYDYASRSEEIKNGQLLKSCITLSPEALNIFNSVATLTTPADIISWLDLSFNHFTKTLPKLLSDKYGDTIASETRISTFLALGISYYRAILSGAEPYSAKLSQEDDNSDTTTPF